MRARFCLLLAMLTLSVLPLLARTDIVHRWVLTGAPMPKFKHVLVASIMENYLVRQHFEDEMEKQLEKNGVTGIASYMVFPPKNEMMEGELKQRIKESSIDAVIVVRPKNVRQETEEVIVGGMYMPPPGYYSFYPYWNMAYSQLYTTSYTQENVVVRVEVNVYNVQNEKLVWSGETDTIYSKDFEKLGKDYAKALVKQLKRDKVVSQK